VEHTKKHGNARTPYSPHKGLVHTKLEDTVRTEYGNTEWFEVRKGVRQVCSLSPYLFNLYTEYIVRRVGFEDNIGIKVGGRTINNLRYADVTTILAEYMRKLLEKLKEESEKAGLMLNLKKTKIMSTGILNEFILDVTKMEIINCYTVLGSIITRDGYNYKEISRGLSIGRMAMTKLEKITKDRDVKKATKIKIAETIIFPTVIYGSESWTVRKKEKKKKKLMPLSYGRGGEFYEFLGQRGERTFQYWTK